MGFVIFVCLKNFAVLFAAVFLNAVLSGKNNFISLLLGFYAFLQYYTILAKVYYCIPIYYFSFLSVNGMIGGDKNEGSSWRIKSRDCHKKFPLHFRSFPVETQAQAREKLHEVKQKYFDATHVVHAFSVGLKSETFGMSDDGEPSGTAGRPVLDVLKGSGITNILLTVTRYFGGTLLGTGGLVHAYSESAKKFFPFARRNLMLKNLHFRFRAAMICIKL